MADLHAAADSVYETVLLEVTLDDYILWHRTARLRCTQPVPVAEHDGVSPLSVQCCDFSNLKLCPVLISRFDT